MKKQTKSNLPKVTKEKIKLAKGKIKFTGVKIHHPSFQRINPIKQKIKLNTVNVIVFMASEFECIHSFSDTPKGNEAAEKIFTNYIRQDEEEIWKEQKFAEAEIDERINRYIDDGEFDGNAYQIYLVHSS